MPSGFEKLRGLPICLLAMVCCCLGAPLLAEERLLVNVQVNGKPAVFAFDTGMYTLAVFPKSRERLGLKMRTGARGLGAGEAAVLQGRTEECEFKLGDTTVKTSLAVVDMPPMLDTGGLDGLIGWDSVQSNIFWIDAAKLEMKA